MNKTVFVTGSSRGIGFETAKIFAENSFNVIINAKSSMEELSNALNILKKINENIISIPGDVSDYNKASEIFDKIEEAFGGVDILINNAGISHFSPFNDTNPEIWDTIIKNNLFSTLNCTRLSMGYMIHQKSGSIVNISSIWGVSGASCEAVYSASKGAVNAFTKAMAKELGPSNICVNAVALGVIDTNMNHFLSCDEKKALKDEIPLGRFGSPREAAELTYSIVKNKYLTGQIISFDGGMI